MRPLRASSIRSSALERYCDSATVRTSCIISSPPAARRSGPACRFRCSPLARGAACRSAVTLSVCGMMFTPKVSPSTALTVNDTPSTATLPFTAMKRARACGTRKRQRVEPFSGVADSAVPTPSTWPETIWPPSSSPIRSERSRFTRVPGCQLAQGRAGQGFRRGIGGKPVRPEFRGGQAAAGAGDGGADGDSAGIRPGRGDDQAHVLAAADRRDAADGAQGGDDAGEHERSRACCCGTERRQPRGSLTDQQAEPRRPVRRQHQAPARVGCRCEPGCPPVRLTTVTSQISVQKLSVTSL